MTLFSGVAPQAAVTASQTSLAKSSSVVENVSGLYSSTHSVSGCSAGELLDQLDGGHRHLDDFRLAHAEHDVAERLRGGVVDVDDGAARAAQGLHRAADQMLARLGEHFDGHVVRNMAAFDQAAHEVEIGLRRGRKRHFDFLETDVAQHPEHAHLAFAVHRLEQGLIAVAQIGAQPDRRRAERLVRPLAVGQGDGGEGAVFGGDGLGNMMTAPGWRMVRTGENLNGSGAKSDCVVCRYKQINRI